MNIVQYRYKWIDPATGKEDTSLPTGVNNIYSDILDGKKVTKLGIKASPGTRVEINGNVFIIGNNGVLTINKPNYIITSLRFLQDYQITKDEEASEQAITNGITLMDTALATLLKETEATITIISDTNSINEVKNIEIKTKQEVGQEATVTTNTELYINTTEEWQARLSIIQTNFLNDYQKGYYSYNKGLRGIYTLKLDDEGNPIKEELYNVIIDIEYESEGGNAQ